MTQTEKILAHLMSGRPLTPPIALKEYGCLRLGARIFELKCKGYPIATTIVADEEQRKHYAQYELTVGRCAG